MLTLIATVAMLTLTSRAASGCNEAVCGSVVSKCTLLRSCDCDRPPAAEFDGTGAVDGQSDESCSCCGRCRKCLDFLWTECCSCFDMCPPPVNLTSTTEVLQESVVFDFNKAEPQLWRALVEDGVRSEFQSGQQWDTYILGAADLPPKPSSSPSGSDVASATVEDNDVDSPIGRGPRLGVKCSVAFLHDCVSINKCKASCRTLGALSGRWFDNGCCQCVGSSCTAAGAHYGLRHVGCSACSPLAASTAAGGSSDDSSAAAIDSNDLDALADDDVDRLSYEELERLEREYEAALLAIDRAD